MFRRGVAAIDTLIQCSHGDGGGRNLFQGIFGVFRPDRFCVLSVVFVVIVLFYFCSPFVSRLGFWFSGNTGGKGTIRRETRTAGIRHWWRVGFLCISYTCASGVRAQPLEAEIRDCVPCRFVRKFFVLTVFLFCFLLCRLTSVIHLEIHHASHTYIHT